MTDFNSNSCVNKLLQGCTYTAGKCPCRLKKTTSEEEYVQTEKYVKTHWKSVVLCEECKHRHKQECPLMVVEFNVDKGSTYWRDMSRPDGWCYRGEKE